MKNKLVIFILVALTLFFATGISFAAKPIIKADTQYLDPSTGLYILKGNVYIEVGNRIITADQAKVDMTSLEVWGSGGINLTQDDIQFTGDSVYVYGTQSRAVIDGGVSLARTDLRITADKVNFNWSNKVATFTGNVSVVQNGNAWTAETVNYNVEANSIL